MAGQYALYKYFDSAERLLYVGKSGNMTMRESAHIRNSQWMEWSVRSTIERHGSAEEVAEAERVAIKTEGPVFNRLHNDGIEARKRLLAYLDEVGRLDLMPTPKARRTKAWTPPDAGVTAEEVMDFVRQILTADTSDHAVVRLRAIGALEGFADLPRGNKLDRLSELARISRATGYRARKEPFPFMQDSMSA